MEKTEKIGLVGPDGELTYVSDCCSQCDADGFDGPALWNSMEEAESANEETGGIPEGYTLRHVTIVIHDKD